MSIAPERLMAYVDGQTDAEESARIRAALQSDPALQAQAALWQAQSQALRAAYDPIMDEAVPARLRELVAPQAQILTFSSRPGQWRSLGAGLAALAAAALLGFQIGANPGSAVLRSGSEGVWAKGVLASALERQASGPNAKGPIAIAFTLDGPDGAPCRAFRVQSQGLDGLACRQRQGWSVLALGTQAKSAPGAYATASGLSASVLASLEGMQSSEALNTEAEAARIKAKWR